MTKDFFYSKKFLIISTAIGAAGMLTFAAISLAYGVMGMGIMPGALFGSLYFSTLLDVLLTVGVVNTIKAMNALNFMNKFEKKYSDASMLYGNLVNQHDKLNQLITSHCNLNKKAKFNNYQIILQEQNKYNNLMKRAEFLNEKEKKAFYKYSKLKQTFHDVSFVDPELDSLLTKTKKQTKNKDVTLKVKNKIMKIKNVPTKLTETEMESESENIAQNNETSTTENLTLQFDEKTL